MLRQRKNRRVAKRQGEDHDLRRHPRGFQHPINTGDPDSKLARDPFAGESFPVEFKNLGALGSRGGFPTLYFPSALALATPSLCRSNITSRSNWLIEPNRLRINGHDWGQYKGDPAKAD
jgi:hypothetical protein